MDSKNLMAEQTRLSSLVTAETQRKTKESEKFVCMKKIRETLLSGDTER